MDTLFRGKGSLKEKKLKKSEEEWKFKVPMYVWKK